ncbi:recombination regulator RecX [Fructobacillus ficulneus]|uniref:Regulatory protein RecX n=1 Tax=Fructobacillus ficulneus TaxID=157463 RepID=A0A0K8MGN1_9LACO|nr:recombination regulator RecX [Fructobacillus ficulneus]GAO99716.1 regulatory protein RecX [Fructobacillus ficulneus]
MQTITKIATQKQAGRYNLELDGRFAFGVSENVLAKFGLIKGRQLDPAMVEAIKAADKVDQGLKIALNYLSPALRTIKQVRDRLLAKKVEEEVVDQVIDHLVAQELLNDAVYAQHYVATKQAFNPKGPRGIAMDLAQAGVAEEIIDEALMAYSTENQIEVAVKLAEKAAKTHRRDSSVIRQQKVAQALVQKGFSFDIASQAISQIDLTNDEEDEQANALRQVEKLAHHHRRLPSKDRYYKVKGALYTKGFRGEMIDWALDQIDWEEEE